MALPKWDANDVKAAGQDCIGFYDVEGKVGVNAVPIKPGVFVPRVGERVSLPGEKGEGAGLYEVLAVRYLYAEATEQRHPVEAFQLAVQVDVKPTRVKAAWASA